MIPAVSVIIPHLNQPDYLRSCLVSLVEQRHGTDDVEIIVVDNGSDEAPIAVCAAFPGVRLIHEGTPGPGPARNRGVAESRAPILAFIDADCIADPGWLDAIVAAFADPATEVVGGDVRIAMSDPRSMTMLEAYESVYSFRQKAYVERKGFAATLNMGVRREVFDRVGGFGGIDIAEDRDWGHRASGMGVQLRFEPAMLVRHPARTSLVDFRRKLDRITRHHFKESNRTWRGRASWMATALAVGLSPAAEVIRVLSTPRLTSFREKGMAAGAVASLRLYRATLMMRLLVGLDRREVGEIWNR